MDEINTGGPAFPVIAENGLGHIADGMTLRDYFAAKAMQGICAHPDTWGLMVPEIADKAYVIADAMLSKRP